MTLIGAQLVRLEPGECEIHLPFKPELTQRHGYYHGGIIGTIADSAGRYAAFTLMPRGRERFDSGVQDEPVGAGGWRNADRPRQGTRGRPHAGGGAGVDAGVVKEGRETLCATLLQTLMTMHGRTGQ